VPFHAGLDATKHYNTHFILLIQKLIDVFRVFFLEYTVELCIFVLRRMKNRSLTNTAISLQREL
jgi:hypothetical protein